MNNVSTIVTTACRADVEVAGYHLGQYTWKIEDAITKLHLQAPRNVDLTSPEFDVGSFTCILVIKLRHEQSKWHFGTFLRMNPEDSDKVAPWGGCTFDLLDGEGSLIKSRILGNHNFKGTLGWGFSEFETAEAVLKQVKGTNSEGTDLHLRVKLHAKGVPAQDQKATDAGTRLLTTLAELKTPQICTQSDDTQDTSEESMLPSSTVVGSAGTGKLTFTCNKSVQIEMPLVATGEDRAQALQLHMQCHELFLENPRRSFTWIAKLSWSDPSVTVHIDRSLVEQLPLLQSLQEKAALNPPHEAEVRGEGALVSKRISKKRKSAQMMTSQTQQAATDEDERNCSVPFTPPASVSGIACVLMLLEDVVTPLKLFTCSCGPRLAVQTLWAASYLGHKKVEQVVTKWLFCVALSMLARNDTATPEAPKDVTGTVELMESSGEEWQQVFGLVPSDTLRTIADDLMNLLPGNSFGSKVLKVPAGIVDHWIDSCNGVISLQSVTVPDVSCVLKLIDRLPHHPEVAVLHIPKLEGGDCNTVDTARVLEALDLVIPGMPKLRVLGLSNLSLTIKNMPEVVSILSVVRDRLQGVALTLSKTFGESTDRVEATHSILRAVGKMAHLQTLRLEHWEEKIDEEHVAGLKPLKVLLPEMPSASYVERMAMVAPDLKFCAVPHF